MANETETIKDMPIVTVEQIVKFRARAIALEEALDKQIKLNEHFACPSCGGIGVVGNAPDDYYDCPECKSIDDLKEALRVAEQTIETLKASNADIEAKVIELLQRLVCEPAITGTEQEALDFLQAFE